MGYSENVSDHGKLASYLPSTVGITLGTKKKKKKKKAKSKGHRRKRNR